MMNTYTGEKAEGLMRQMGMCKFCGQYKAIETCGGMSDDRLNEIATEECTCEEAKKEQAKGQTIEKAYDNIHKLLGEDKAGDILLAAVIPVYEGDVDSVTVNLGDGTRVSIQTTNNRKVKLIRVRNIKDSLEA